MRKELLAECFDNYLVLKPGERPEYEQLKAAQFPEAGTMVNSIEERGRVRGLRDNVRRLLEKKFGPLPQPVLERIESLSPERLDEILLAVLDARSLDELGLTG